MKVKIVVRHTQLKVQVYMEIVLVVCLSVCFFPLAETDTYSCEKEQHPLSI